MELSVTFILTFLDAYLYGYCYEHRIKQRDNPTGIFQGTISRIIYGIISKPGAWLFWEYKKEGRTYVPLYRIFIQWPADILGLYLIYKNCGLTGLTATLLAWYLMVKEYSYYFILGQLEIAKEFVDPYWLRGIWFSGAWLFSSGYSYERFFKAAVYAIAIMCIASLLGGVQI